MRGKNPEMTYRARPRARLALGWATRWWRRFAILCPLLAATAIALPAQTFTVLYRFTGGTDGAYPQYGGLIADAAGNLYGTAPSMDVN